MRTYPTRTANRNVPAGVFLIAEASTMSGEIVTTYYADKEGNLWGVKDWKGCRPYPVYPFQVCGLTGDTLNIIAGRIEAHFRGRP